MCNELVNIMIFSFGMVFIHSVLIGAALRRVHNISSPFHHNRKPLIFQWALTLRNAGIGLGSIPAFRPLKN